MAGREQVVFGPRQAMPGQPGELVHYAAAGGTVAVYTGPGDGATDLPPR